MLMLIDIILVLASTALLTLLTAKKDNILPQTSQNSFVAGSLVSVVQLIFIISTLDGKIIDSSSMSSEEVYDYASMMNLMVTVLKKFRPMLIGFLLKLILQIVNKFFTKKKNVEPCNIKESAAAFDMSLLSRREVEVARLASKGYTNNQIADELFISTETVKRHMASIFEKLNIESRKELMMKKE